MEDYQVADLSELGSTADGRLLSNEDVAWPQILRIPVFQVFRFDLVRGGFFGINP